LDTQIIAAHRDQGRIATLQVVDHAGVRELTVDAFVDATGEADLARFGGASVRHGNHGWCRTARWACASVACRRSVQGVREAVRAARAQAVGRAL